MEKSVYWIIYFILIVGCAIGVIFVFPYIFSVQKDLLGKIPISLAAFFIIQLVQSLVIFSIAILIGLKLYKSTGFAIPYLEAFASGKKIPQNIRKTVFMSAKFGVLAAVTIVALDYLFGLFGLNLLSQTSINISAWQRFLVSFYGGINEEVLMRLFLMTAIVWSLLKLTKGKKSNPVYWSAIIITSIIFGLGHLPITASIIEITGLVVFRAILLNSVGGIIFGWLYWKKGLEAAIVAHFTADVFIHLLIPPILGSLNI